MSNTKALQPGRREVPRLSEFLLHAASFFSGDRRITFYHFPMFEEEASDNIDTTEAIDMGKQRFASMSMFDAPVFIPPDPAWAPTVQDLARKQLCETANMETLLCSYIELLIRAKALVEFWDNNVGPTEDWPVSMVGESAEVELCLERRFSKLRSVVSFVEESACS